MNSSGSRPTIISLGEVLWDLFSDGAQFGGAPANFACHAALLGGDVCMLSAVGNDDRGREAIGILSRYGIDVSLVQVIDDSATGCVGVDVDEDGKPTFTIHEESAWDRIGQSDELDSRVSDADLIYFGTLGQRAELSWATIRRVLEVASANKIPRVLDVNLRAPFYDADMIRDSIESASILKLSDDELGEVLTALCIDEDATESALRALLAVGGLEMIIMTRGSDGALLVTESETLDQAGVSTTVVDTVGAGDAFTASFVIGLLSGEAHGNCLVEACKVATATCRHAGAVPATG